MPGPVLPTGFYQYARGDAVQHPVHGQGVVRARRSSEGLRAGGVPQYLVKFRGKSNLTHCDEIELTRG